MQRQAPISLRLGVIETVDGMAEDEASEHSV
jgi:hypothetical protein